MKIYYILAAFFLSGITIAQKNVLDSTITINFSQLFDQKNNDIELNFKKIWKNNCIDVPIVFTRTDTSSSSYVIIQERVAGGRGLLTYSENSKGKIVDEKRLKCKAIMHLPKYGSKTPNSLKRYIMIDLLINTNGQVSIEKYKIPLYLNFIYN